VTPSDVVFKAATWVKSMYMTQSWWETRKRKYGNQRNCT